MLQTLAQKNALLAQSFANYLQTFANYLAHPSVCTSFPPFRKHRAAAERAAKLIAYEKRLRRGKVVLRVEIIVAEEVIG
jgi:hypothetical protein